MIPRREGRLAGAKVALAVIAMMLVGGCADSQERVAAADRSAAQQASAGEGPRPSPSSQAPAPPSVAVSSEAHEMGDGQGPFIRATDQTGEGDSLVIEEVVFAESPGWVVIHAGPDIIGVSGQLPAGKSGPIKVTLTRPLRYTERMLAMLHNEDNANSTFDFPDGDLPTLQDDVIVAVPVLLQVG